MYVCVCECVYAKYPWKDRKGTDNSGGSPGKEREPGEPGDRDVGVYCFFYVYLMTFEFFTTCLYSPFKINVIK